MSAAPRTKDWAVVGGGFLGLTLALRLAQAGHRVTVYEAAPSIGGLAGSWQVGDVTWDRHYHVTLFSDRSVRRLLDELGVGDLMDWVETKTGCYADGRLWSVSNAWEFLRFPALKLSDKLRLGATMAYASRLKDWRRLERISVEEWLTKLSGKRAFDRFWLPLLRSKLGDQYRHTSAAFMWATIARLSAARRSGLEKELFGYVHGGYARVLTRFSEHLRNHGVELALGRPIREVAPDGRAVAVTDHAGERVLHDRAVVTVAAPLAARMVPGLSATERSALEAIRYLGIVCASLVLDAPLAGYYLTNILDAGFPFTGVVEASAFVDRQAQLGGKTLVYLPRYCAPDDPYLKRDDATVEAEFLAGLERMFPEVRPDGVLGFRVSRVKYVCALSTQRYSETLPPMKTSLPGVWIVNSAHIANGTLNVNETVELAERAARLLRAG